MMLRKVFLAVSIVLILFIAVGIYVAEATLHVPKKLITQQDMQRASALSDKYQCKLINAELHRPDAVLRGWYFQNSVNQRVVILLHGQADNRAGMFPYAEMFLKNKYDVLAPDSRAHGQSGGSISTYGIKEVKDLSSWIDWLQQKNPGVQVFGLGESMGAAILLQSLRNESRWKGIVAESPFSDFRTIAIERLDQKTGLPSSPVVDTAFAYARMRYGLKMRTVSPADAVSNIQVPVLLIHGMKHKNITHQHSTKIAARNDSVDIWKVPNTGHTAALGTHPKEFEQRVLSLFSGLE